MEKRKLSGSITMKIGMFILMAVSVLTGIGMAIVTLYLAGNDAYTGSEEELLRQMIQPLSYEDYGYLRMRFEYEEESAMAEYCRKHGIGVSIEDENGVLLFRQMDGDAADYPYDFFFYFALYREEVIDIYDYVYPGQETDTDYGLLDTEREEMQIQSDPGETIPKNGYDNSFTAYFVPDQVTDSPNTESVSVLVNYTMSIYVDPANTVGKYAERYGQVQRIYELRYVFPVVALICFLTVIICFLFLMCAAGHRNGCEGVMPTVLRRVPLELLAVFVILLTALWIICLYIFSSQEIMILIIFALGFTFETVLITLFCMELAIRLKMGECMRQTLIWRVLHLLGRGGGSIFRALCQIPLVWKIMTGYLVLSALEFIGVLLLCRVEVLLLWGGEKAVLFILLLFAALTCKKLQKGSEALANGDMTYHLDTSRMIMDFRKHGENLNSIGQGISKAVEDRMRSERLKTELITNVSHDLKTPLTSIINYADLLGKKELTTEQIGEYSEVLLRQSKRLKKLLEDLVEASKATTGNLEVVLQPCEISVLLSQAIGEYEPRFAEKELELLTTQPEQPITIQADGRHLWRVFDNLLNNIYKYAQDGSRVYINVEQEAGKVRIIFRNMSKYALNISPQELEERFVRGDSSRHLEGNGLGLSIAKSLTELQQGVLNIYVDGDLFKVILEFPVV